MCCPLPGQGLGGPATLGQQAESPLRGPVAISLQPHESNVAAKHQLREASPPRLQAPQLGPDGPGLLPAGLTRLHPCLLLTGSSPSPLRAQETLGEAEALGVNR